MGLKVGSPPPSRYSGMSITLFLSPSHQPPTGVTRGVCRWVGRVGPILLPLLLAVGHSFRLCRGVVGCGWRGWE